MRVDEIFDEIFFLKKRFAKTNNSSNAKNEQIRILTTRVSNFERQIRIFINEFAINKRILFNSFNFVVNFHSNFCDYSIRIR